MKRTVVLVAMFVAVLVAGPVAAQGTIVGSAHDFSGVGSFGGGEICKACHTPHNAYRTVYGQSFATAAAPLWNHEDTAASFTLYESPTGTFNSGGTITQPAGVSKACLSCHDGTVGMESFGGVSTDVNMMTGSALIGIDLRNDHPISFLYDDDLATTTDGELHPPTTTGALGGTIATKMLFNGRMECGSCHDVHNTPGFPSMLLMSNSASALCLTCHDK